MTRHELLAKIAYQAYRDYLDADLPTSKEADLAYAEQVVGWFEAHDSLSKDMLEDIGRFEAWYAEYRKAYQGEKIDG